MSNHSPFPPSDRFPDSGPSVPVLLSYIQRPVYQRNFEYLGHLGCMQLAAYLNAHGQIARVFVGWATELAALAKDLAHSSALCVVGLSCDYDNLTAVLSISRHLTDELGLDVVIGGPQVAQWDSASCHAALMTSKAAVLIRGDGEQTLLEWLVWREQPALARAEEIPGLIFIDANGSLVETPRRPLIKDLDALPRPSLHDCLQPKFDRNLAIIAARGCPYQCTFCFEGGNTRTLRIRSVSAVLKEIEARLAETPDARYLWFADDTFTLNAPRTQAFCAGLKELRKRHDFVWFCEGHARLLSRQPELLDVMIDAGMVRLQIGMETGRPDVMDAYNKQISVADVTSVIRDCFDKQLPMLAGNFILGGALETPEGLQHTMEHMTNLLNRYPGLLDLFTSFFIPLPNTAMAKAPEEFGLRVLDPAMLTSLEDYPVVETAALSRQDLSQARQILIAHAYQTMCRCYTENRIPHARILEHYRLAFYYGLASIWFKFVYRQDLTGNAWFTMLATSSAQPMTALTPADWWAWHPCRVLEPEQFPDTLILDPSERLLLQTLDGNYPLRTIVNRSRACLPFSTEEIPAILEQLTRRRLMLFFPP